MPQKRRRRGGREYQRRKLLRQLTRTATREFNSLVENVENTTKTRALDIQHIKNMISGEKGKSNCNNESFCGEKEKKAENEGCKSEPINEELLALLAENKVLKQKLEMWHTKCEPITSETLALLAENQYEAEAGKVA